jgi:hypothetical protein
VTSGRWHEDVNNVHVIRLHAYLLLCEILYAHVYSLMTSMRMNVLQLPEPSQVISAAKYQRYGDSTCLMLMQWHLDKVF